MKATYIWTSEVTNMNKRRSTTDVQVILAPLPFVSLYSVGKLLEHSPNIALAAQNVIHKPSGAYTGEISVECLKP
jgi:triosephosphate isomerase